MTTVTWTMDNALPAQQDAHDTVAMDAIDRLPLSIIPLETKTLQRAHLIKNMQLEGVLELFKSEGTGSGQLRPDQLQAFFGWKANERKADLLTIERLGALNSYDVYSLRIELRRLGISIQEINQLNLSDAKTRELTRYMKTFTEPLIQQVYGGNDREIKNFDELISMFERPNKEEALKNLKVIAEKLQIDLIEVPRFLEDYGDVFLSLAYFKEHLDELVPQIQDFLEAAVHLRTSHQLKSDYRYTSSVDYLDEQLNAIITSITGRFESFNQHTANMWRDINATSFRKVRTLITGHHTTVGGVLCGLKVKMGAWHRRFGHLREGAATLSRSEFIMGEMRQGIDRIREIEASAPKIADLN